jgi:soluble lytic murein transglycosylase-like protein
MMRAELAAAVLLLGLCADPAAAQTAPPVADRIASAVAESVQRFGLPETWLRAVMHRESADDPRATSVKGAMGLMQLMPGTWATLRLELRLGADPYDVHDNILAGAAYLRQLYDQFGADGFLAAYNAGPARYLEFLARGRPLPSETRAYVAAIAPRLGGRTAAPAPSTPPSLAPAPPPSVFVTLDGFDQRQPGASNLFPTPAAK